MNRARPAAVPDVDSRTRISVLLTSGLRAPRAAPLAAVLAPLPWVGRDSTDFLRNFDLLENEDKRPYVIVYKKIVMTCDVCTM